MKSAVVLACDDNFVPFASVVARRIARLASEPITIIVVSDGVTEENKALATRFCPQIGFIEASHARDQSYPADSILRTPYCTRLFLDELLPDIGRALYLDGDVSLLRDVSYLLNFAPTAAPVMAAHDTFVILEMDVRARLSMTSDAPYFNSGVMVLDLDALRTEGVLADARLFAEQHPEACKMPDQDALNAVLNGRWQTLDWRWNAVTHLAESMPKPPFLRHFAGNKPWGASKHGVEARFVREWRSDLEESPWRGRFHHNSRWQTATAALRPHIRSAEMRVKHSLFSRSSGKRGERARLARRFPLALAAIESHAAEGRLACRSPETVLFGRTARQ